MGNSTMPIWEMEAFINLIHNENQTLVFYLTGILWKFGAIFNL